MNYQRGNSGELSIATCVLNLAGNLARVFTTLVLTKVGCATSTTPCILSWLEVSWLLVLTLLMCPAYLDHAVIGAQVQLCHAKGSVAEQESMAFADLFCCSSSMLSTESCVSLSLSFLSITVSSTHSRLVVGLAGQVDHGKHSIECRFEFNLVGTKLADCSHE